MDFFTALMIVIGITILVGFPLVFLFDYITASEPSDDMKKLLELIRKRSLEKDMERIEVIELSQKQIECIIANEYGVHPDAVCFGNHPYWISATITKKTPESDTNKEWSERSKEWQDGWRAYQQGDDIGMSDEEYRAKSDEWKEGAKFACEHPFGPCSSSSATTGKWRIDK